MTRDPELGAALRGAVRAGRAVLEVYAGDFQVAYKSDRSPLTLADRRGHEIILAHLAPLALPVLSEEGRDIPYAERRRWRRLWIVDPLDGTKEFVKRLGEFTVNIALVEEGRPVMGVVYVPVKRRLYFGRAGEGAFRVEEPAAIAALEEEGAAPAAGLPAEVAAAAVRLPIDESAHTPFVIVGSRSHATPELEAFVAAKRRELGDVDFVSTGSSLKYLLVAEGRADLYPRLGPTMEWDTAAGQVIAEAAGARVTRWEDGGPMVYNKENLLNPWHLVARRPPAARP
jgi:3'(2'), 5'-bisphosphate nucleotidase